MTEVLPFSRPADPDAYARAIDLGLAVAEGAEELTEEAMAAAREYLLAELERVNWTPPAQVEVDGQYLTKAAMAESLGVSPRTLDNRLTDDGFLAATGAYKTSSGRNAHWRFPPDAPARARAYLRKEG